MSSRPGRDDRGQISPRSSRRSGEAQPVGPIEGARFRRIPSPDAGGHGRAAARQAAGRTRESEEWERTARLVNLVVPVGWLPLGVMSAAEGRVVPSLLGLLGMTLIGTASLWKAYRSTIGQYQGQSTQPEASAGDRGQSGGDRKEAGRCCSWNGVSPAFPSRSRPSRWRGFARSCGHPRRR